MVRVYIVQGLNLRPCDKNGDSDPYIQIEYGNHKVIIYAVYCKVCSCKFKRAYF